MASTQRKPPLFSDFRQGKHNSMHHVISSDVMGNRNVEVVPVGAWVEPADNEIQTDAVEAAQIEHEKIQRLQEEKENRLRNFRRQTKQRVNNASRIKRQQQIQEAEQAFERERRVVQQSCLTAENTHRDTCLHRQELDLAIKNRLLHKYGEDISTWDREESANFESQTQEGHEEAGKARQQLNSRKIAQKGDSFTNPGISRITRDIQNPTVRSVVEIDDLPASTRSKTDDDDDDDDNEKEDEEKDLSKEDKEQDDDDELKGKDEQEGTESRLSVQFTEPTHSTREGKRKKHTTSAKRPRSGRLSAVLSQDAENDALARQRRQQAAVSRRIFMDREREAVRENIRRKQHEKKIVRLKNEKEAYRQELEAMAFRELEPTDPVTGETAQEKRLREKLEAMEVKEMVDRRADEMRRAREMERYLSALKHSLIEKVTRQGIQLPALCACSETVWDTHPETCANNCFFYRNHRAYARALQSLLSSADLL